MTYYQTDNLDEYLKLILIANPSTDVTLQRQESDS